MNAPLEWLLGRRTLDRVSDTARLLGRESEQDPEVKSARQSMLADVPNISNLISRIIWLAGDRHFKPQKRQPAVS